MIQSHKSSETQSGIFFFQATFSFVKFIPKWEILAMQEEKKYGQHFCVKYYVILLVWY